MSDLISRQAVNTLVDELARAISDERCFMSRGRSTGEIMSDILNLPSVENKGEWIPVSERLPEESTWVLVTCKNPDGYIFLDIKLINRYSKMWDGDEDFIGTVLAWKPLPEPYKKGGE